ncbi:helix-turn-helix domain-containing protein [Alkalibacter sp. M17DMB]|nr:helix-turn-helix domain-containing protein [Alkalibacter mobilis]
MFEAIIEKRNLRHILELTFKYLENPIIVTDSRYRLIDLYPDKRLNEPVWDNIREKGYATQELMNQIESDKTKEETLKRNFPFFLDWGFAGNFKRIARKISDGKNFFGVIGVLESYRTFKNIDLEIVESLNKVIVNILLDTDPPNAEESSYKQTLLSNIIEGDLADRNKLEYSFEISKTNWKPPYKIVDIPFDIKNFHISTLRNIQDTIIREIPKVQTTMHGSNLVVLLYGGDKYNGIEKIGRILKKIDFDCGVSDDFFDLTDGFFYYRQSKVAYDYGVKEKKETNIHCFNEYYEVYFYDTLNKDEDCKMFIYSGTHKLIEYDKAHGTDFTDTLSTYLNCFKNIPQASEMIHIHRNTLNYRIKKAEEILGVSLDDDRICRQIQTSINIMKNRGSA